MTYLRIQSSSVRLRFSLFLLIATAALVGSVPANAQSDFNDRDNILIADQFNNRVIEVERSTHKIVWQFGNGSDTAGPNSVVGPNDAERFGRFTLISGTGIPPSNPPLPGCSDPVNGCPDNRVMIVDREGQILWQYGQANVSGAGFNQLNTPVHALYLSDFFEHCGPHVMITDQANERIIVVNLWREIVWQYGTTGVSGNGPNELNNPNSAELLENGHILISDESNNRVIEVTEDHQIVRQFTAGGTINGAAFASRLRDGHTLISDSNNNRIVEVDSNDVPVWQYVTNTMPGSNPNPLPTRGIRLKNGNTLISDQFNNRVIEVTRDKRIVFQQGMLNVTGNGFNQLNGPYDAKAIRDFTGLTPPFDSDSDHGNNWEGHCRCGN
ncbi:MAG: hypothetical protein JO097_04550 [Acidobacteriaceae bacterium]|nr:hypothetical protein [Acidobacteriaceae bacterium]